MGVSLDFNTLDIIAYNRRIVNQVAFRGQINCGGNFCAMRKSCCHSAPVALKYGHFDTTIDSEKECDCENH